MRKISLIGFVMLIVSIPTFAGGLLTNTNQHVAFLRMLARGASIDIDGVYSNPAGLAFLPSDGLYLSLNGQSAYQTRNIDMTFPLFPEDGHRRYYKGTASAPFIPSFQGLQQLVGAGAVSDLYTLNSAMDGSQFIYGVQLGLSYKINDWLAVFAGGRMNYFSGGYEGFLTATANSELPSIGGKELAGIELDCDQTGWGITPILGADIKLGKWNIGLKYEFMTNLNLENKTKMAEVRQNGIVMPDKGNPLADFKDGVNTPSDIPALLTAAVGYEILPTLRASVEYHHFFDKDAGMANDKQDHLKHGTHEILLGAEWDVTKQLTISGGFQNTDYGLSDDFQSDISFSCDSYSLGFGAAIKMTKHLTMNVAYFWTNYKDYKKVTESVLGLSATTYSRTNKVFGLGVADKF